MKLKLKILMIILVVLLSGCGKQAEGDLTPTPTGTQGEKNDLFEVINADKTENNEFISGEITGGVIERIEKQENLAYVKYDAANRYRTMNSSKNMQSLFCIDENTGAVYFVNQSKDWYIYRLVDGVAELVVELPARELYMRNETLYFIVEDYDKYSLTNVTEGDIYAYTPADGKITKVFSAEALEGPISHIIPYEDGIAMYYSVDAGDNEAGIKKMYTYWVYYTFADNRLETDAYRRAYPGWEDYYLISTFYDDDYKTLLVSREKGVQDILDFSIPAANSFILDDVLYAWTGSTFLCTNIITGKQQLFDINELYHELVTAEILTTKDGKEIKAQVNGCTMTKDYLWLIVQYRYLMQINPETGEAVCYKLQSDKGELLNLYTDGIQLYASYIKEGYADYGPLVRICTEEIAGYDATYGVPILELEYVTE